jgi:type IV secretory pathway VirB9-like protein
MKRPLRTIAILMAATMAAIAQPAPHQKATTTTDARKVIVRNIKFHPDEIPTINTDYGFVTAFVLPKNTRVIQGMVSIGDPDLWEIITPTETYAANCVLVRPRPQRQVKGPIQTTAIAIPTNNRGTFVIRITTNHQEPIEAQVNILDDRPIQWVQAVPDKPKPENQ